MYVQLLYYYMTQHNTTQHLLPMSINYNNNKITKEKMPNLTTTAPSEARVAPASSRARTVPAAAVADPTKDKN